LSIIRSVQFPARLVRLDPAGQMVMRGISQRATPASHIFDSSYWRLPRRRFLIETEILRPNLIKNRRLLFRPATETQTSTQSLDLDQSSKASQCRMQRPRTVRAGERSEARRLPNLLAITYSWRWPASSSSPPGRRRSSCRRSRCRSRAQGAAHRSPHPCRARRRKTSSSHSQERPRRPRSRIAALPHPFVSSSLRWTSCAT